MNGFVIFCIGFLFGVAAVVFERELHYIEALKKFIKEKVFKKKD